jgi:FlaA1/EpsC-like NDP-sugar epimerase
MSFLETPRPAKRLISLVYDSISIFICISLAMLISKVLFNITDSQINLQILITVIVSLGIFTKTGFYRAILRYMGLKALFTIAIGLTLSTVTFALVSYLLSIPINSITVFLYWSFSLVAIGGARLIMIAIIRSQNESKKVVAVYGAGSSGRQLAKALGQSTEYKIAAFIDDEHTLVGTEIDGAKVYSPISLERVLDRYDITQVLLAMPRATHSRRSEVLSSLEPFAVKVKTIASMEDIVDSKVQIDQLKEIEIEDLLGRDSVEPNQSLLHSCITDKVVMVTGAGGSIGSELCRQIVILRPHIIVLYELSEYALYTVEKELRTLVDKRSSKIQIIPLLGSVQHRRRLKNVMQKYQVQTVYHAAAYKHVPIVELNIVEGIRNNVFGTWYAAEAAAESGVERFVLVSTDKAVRSTNIMGASKRFAELVLQAINTRNEKTIFTMVRFGNVLGSSGSVVPLFREQIRAGGPITVTHRDIIRYFMTIPEAAQLVIQAGAMGVGGDVFVLDMGDQVKISELAERMVHLMGLTVKNSKNPQGDIEINYSGLRPGEKLYEELLIGENVVGTNHSKIMTAKEELLPWNEMQKALILMNELCESMDCDGIVQLLLKIPTGYNPQHAVCDLLWDENKDENNVIRFKTLT